MLFNVGKVTNFFWNGQASEPHRSCIGPRADFDNIYLHFNYILLLTQ